MKFPLAHRVQKPTRYVPAIATDIRKTIARAKRELVAERIVVVTYRVNPKEIA
jgi:hypothetical protein